MFSGASDPMPHISDDQPARDPTPISPNKSFSLLFGTLGAIVVIAGLLVVFGVRFTSDYMMYDPAKEITVKGTVAGLAEYACPGADGELERHLTLKTTSGDYEIHLAPSRVMRSVGWEFKAGQTIEVLGAQVRYRGQDGLIARQIREGENVYTLRGTNGVLLIKQ
jgi:hypothetical protein